MVPVQLLLLADCIWVVLFHGYKSELYPAVFQTLCLDTGMVLIIVERWDRAGGESEAENSLDAWKGAGELWKANQVGQM